MRGNKNGKYPQTGPRSDPQLSRKEIQIKKALYEMLSLGIIKPSNAVYYSHPVVVQKTADV